TGGIVREGRIVAGILVRGDAVGGVVKIVVPLGGEENRTVLIVARMERYDVALILGHEMDFTARETLADVACHLLKDRLLARILDLVDGIEPQSVEAELLQPVDRVIKEAIAHRRLFEANGRAPRGLSFRVEELWSVEAEIIPVRTEVVVDHVKDHHQ